MSLSKDQWALFNACPFLVGDQVQLLSGGPFMTVVNLKLIEDDRGEQIMIACGYFNGFGNSPIEASASWDYKVSPFPIATLQLIKSKPSDEVLHKELKL